MRSARYDFDFARRLGRRFGRGLCERLAGLCLVSGPVAPDPPLLDNQPRPPTYGDNRNTPNRDKEVR
ncbi:hypothetical protein [Streptomyces sp. NBC_00258]|uniref:hypothetical protein n=1 Tax=Streptomyces sp. NBC_00258 TaxID=2903642 RepID=UPI002E2C821C|nr:hypothetical protein [Streptomyces sp. NBC_00258]